MGYYDIKDRLSSSGIKHLLKSPRHYQLYLLNGIETTEAMNHGQFIHTATMEKSEIHKRFRLMPVDGLDKTADGKIEFRSKNNKDLKAEFIVSCEEAGIIPIIKKEDWDEILATAGSITELKVYQELFGKASIEEEILWEDPVFGIPMKAKLDLLRIKKPATGEPYAIIGDIKKFPEIDIDSIKGYICAKERRINTQLAVYEEAVMCELKLPVKFFIVIACSKELQMSVPCLVPTHCYDSVSPYRDYSIDAGRQIYHEAKRMYKDCLDKYGNPWDNDVIWPGLEYFSDNEFGLIEL